MLAYVAYYEGEEWCLLIHGETPGQAKGRFVRCDPSQSVDEHGWNSIRLKRIPGLDDVAITYKSAKAAGFTYRDDWTGEDLSEDLFINSCRCPVCEEEVFYVL